MSLKIMEIVFLTVIFKAVCEDHRNITITNSKTTCL